VLLSLQLLLDAEWSWVFFGLRQPGWAFAEVVAFGAAGAATTVAMFRVTAPAGLLFVPYLLWVAFAGALNLAIWRLNVRAA
jgi:tryptophan-rich sensory protein